MPARRAFTLIELLIVVAIIAILAAIAVPNFLEAQTRSKVSRTLADMRSLKTALELYAVDYNKYPLGRDCNDLTQPGFPEGPVKYRLVLVTTPIAYISTLPGDVFNTQLAGGFPTPCDEASWVYLLKQFHVNESSPWVLGASSSNSPDWTLWPIGQKPAWLVIGKGPSGQADNATITIQAIPYDPTNGTVSAGELATWGPGGGLTD